MNLRHLLRTSTGWGLKGRLRSAFPEGSERSITWALGAARPRLPHPPVAQQNPSAFWPRPSARSVASMVKVATLLGNELTKTRREKPEARGSVSCGGRDFREMLPPPAAAERSARTEAPALRRAIYRRRPERAIPTDNQPPRHCMGGAMKTEEADLTLIPSVTMWFLHHIS